ncbi:MAG: fucose isomerase [Clostridia bacterium]|nr:fucose isomerase [Clostridia bacterium]
MESAEECFRASAALLKKTDGRFVCPEEKLLSIDAVKSFLSGLDPNLVVFQNLTFANSAYISEVLRACSCPVLLWTLREPVIDGGRLRLNSLTGAYSASNAMRQFGKTDFTYVFGSPSEERTAAEIGASVKAAEIRAEMRNLRIAAVGHTPQGFGFGRALDAELLKVFGAELESVEARELIDRARSYTDEEIRQYLDLTEQATCGFSGTPEKNRLDHARLCKAYSDYVSENKIGALASRCWPDFFTAFGTPVCTVLSLLNDRGIAAACEADIYGALSMWIGMKLTGAPVFFGDPVSLDEDENSVTFWHCGAAACSLARRDTGAVVGVHPNRKIGPAMDFGCRKLDGATVFRIGREADGSFRMFITEGEGLDKPKQFTGTSIVIKTDSPARDIVEKSVRDGFEPHFIVAEGRIGNTLCALARYLGIPVFRY